MNTYDIAIMTNQQWSPAALVHELFTAAQLAPGEGIENAVGRLAALVEAQQPATSVTREFTNELGNAIRITVEGPNSTHENIVTPMEAEQLRSALNEHAQQPTTHVQNPAEIERVAGDVSKNGTESNMTQQPAPSEQQPFGWIKQSEIDSSNDFGGSINLWRQKYDCDVPVYLAQQPAPSAVADLIAALEEARSAINSMKVEAETAGQGDEQMMLEACETISNEGLQADTAIRAALASAPKPSSTPQADSQPAPVRDYPPLPDFETVEQHIYGACRRYITQDMLEPIHNLIRDVIDADRAAKEGDQRG